MTNYKFKNNSMPFYLFSKVLSPLKTLPFLVRNRLSFSNLNFSKLQFFTTKNGPVLLNKLCRIIGNSVSSDLTVKCSKKVQNRRFGDKNLIFF